MEYMFQNCECLNRLVAVEGRFCYIGRKQPYGMFDGCNKKLKIEYVRSKKDEVKNSSSDLNASKPSAEKPNTEQQESEIKDVDNKDIAAEKNSIRAYMVLGVS